jgi:hypothetical protein
VEGEPDGIYSLFVERRFDQVEITGDRGLLDELLDVAPPHVEAPVGA